MKPHIFILLTLHSLSNQIDLREASEKLKYILTKTYDVEESALFLREHGNVTEYANNALRVLHETERIGEYLKYVNVSDCNIKGNRSYVKRHIYYGMLLSPDVPDTHWDEFKSVFNKEYKHPLQESAALRQWRRNLRQVVDHNRGYLTGVHSYTLQLNELADLSTVDYMRRILRHMNTFPLHDPAEDLDKSTLMENLGLFSWLPLRVDWREKGFMPRREQQYSCGACYAFAVAHAVQAQMYMNNRDWSELSTQQIVDCSGLDGNAGCAGGSLRGALRYVAREGLMMERHYPYLGMKGICFHNMLSPRVRPRRWAMVPANDELALQRAVATIGPLAVAVNASPKTFQLYRSGIYDDPTCTPWRLNHAMLLVGYTPDSWLLLNWWGQRWGEGGYMRIRRGFNRCGIASMAAYVEL